MVEFKNRLSGSAHKELNLLIAENKLKLNKFSKKLKITWKKISKKEKHP